MIHDPQHTVTAARALPDMRLALTFADGFEATVSLKQWSRRKPLRALADAAVFRRARVDARGGYVVWIADDLELAAEHNLELTDDAAQADVILVNTGSIREKAQEKVFSQLGRWRQLKSSSRAL